ncbi:HAMP domain-containing sensor histidine kinase [Microbacterium sp. NM3R9]|uniref:sensor histidine kinase n=1 Tax=Microbacterium thalli TaxID=3027921 RepID=UPI002366A2DE|nr:sensor histidine kinase [Microbacterium thalli]MDN8549706.1 HAMP domain-containing sensor histidine kinase [Microbacterium thalli]
MLSRPQIQPYAQFLMGASAGMITATVAIVEPARITPAYLVGFAVIVVSCVVMALVWRAQPTVATEWICIVPLVTILACAPLRSNAIDVLPVTGMLVIFPVAWLAFAFPPAVAALGVVVAGSLPLATSLPRTPGEWMALLTVPALLGMFAAASRFVAVDLGRNRNRAQRASHRLAAALDSSTRTDAALRQLLDTTPEAVVVFGDDDAVLLANAPAREIARRGGIRISLEQDGTTHVYGEDRVTPVAVGPGLRDATVAGAFAEPRRVWVGEPGDQVALRFVARPIVLDDEPIGVMVVAQDVTELVDAVDVRDRFLDTVGHELRTPLTVILGNAELAVAGAMPEHRERWETVQRAAERLEHTVELMLATGRAHLTPRPGRSDVRAVVDEAVAGLEDDRGVSISVTGDAAAVEVARDDLHAVVAELVRNAVQASPDGGAVSVDIRSSADAVEVAVTDSGPGMTAAERRQAFDRFYRTARARRGAVQGLGLGLALARALVEAHGGTVQLHPHAPGGTSAIVALPRATTLP